MPRGPIPSKIRSSDRHTPGGFRYAGRMAIHLGAERDRLGSAGGAGILTHTRPGVIRGVYEFTMLTLKQFQDWDRRRDALKPLPRRPLVLLTASWAYRVLPVFEHDYPDDNRPRNTIKTALIWVLKPTRNNLKKAINAAYAAAANAYDNSFHAYAAAVAAGRVVNVVNGTYAAAAYAASYAARAYTDLWPWLYETYLHHIGEGREWNPHWATPEAVAIARKCVLELDTSDLPYLADALTDVGYPYESDLKRLRSGQGEWSDWPAWNLIV